MDVDTASNENEHVVKATNAGFNVTTFNDVCRAGLKVFKESDIPEIDRDHPYSLCYTSGTTGDPKGAVYTHGNIVAQVAGIMFSSISVSSSDVHLSYLPLAHIAERGTFINVMYNGAKLGIFSGSISGNKKLLASDMAMLQPTLFVGVPRIYNLFYTKIEEGMKKAKGVKAWLLKKAIATKLHNL